MTTLIELDIRHLEELADFQRERNQKKEALEQQQRDFIRGVICLDSKAETTLQNLLFKERQVLETEIGDDMGLLRHIHALERENLLEKLAKRDELAKRIVAGKNKTNARDL